MIKCRSCGFENTINDVCVKCGCRIQRYVKVFLLKKSGDVSTIKEELNAGNVLIVNLLPFLKQREGTKPPSIQHLDKAIAQLHDHALSIGGDIARIGDERLVLTPSTFKIGRAKPQSREQLFTKCPHCGVSIKTSNIDRHMAKAHRIPDWAEEAVVSQGTFARFLARNADELTKQLSNPISTPTNVKLHAMASTYMELDEFAEGAMETGKFREAILAVDRLKEEIGGLEIEIWALDTQLSILRAWKPGFIEAIAELFYTEAKCRNCSRKHKEEIRCKEGVSECIFDIEFEGFLENILHKIVEHLTKGEYPPELEVPKHLQDKYIKIRNLIEAEN